MFKVNNKDTRKTFCARISHLVLVFLLLTLNMQLPAGVWINFWKQSLKCEILSTQEFFPLSYAYEHQIKEN